jgi:hypothetical protein
VTVGAVFLPIEFWEVLMVVAIYPNNAIALTAYGVLHVGGYVAVDWHVPLHHTELVEKDNIAREL